MNTYRVLKTTAALLAEIDALGWREDFEVSGLAPEGYLDLRRNYDDAAIGKAYGSGNAVNRPLEQKSKQPSGWQAHGCEVLDADGAWIADCSAEHAPLIAASEDLLAALEDMTARLRVCARVGGSDKEYVDIACSQADAAIARVRSQS